MGNKEQTMERTPLTDEQRLRDLAYHQVDQNTANAMAALRGKYYALGEVLLLLSDCRERALALTALEESSMRAIQCLAVTHGQRVPPTLPDEVG